MKKLLLASTALVATAGVASAQDIALSGDAEMGIFNPNTETSEAQFFTDVDVTFTMTGEADNGLTFGASIDLDESDGSGSCDAFVAQGGGVVSLNGDFAIGGNPLNPADDASCSVSGASGAFGGGTQGGEAIFVSFGGATLTMGDTDGALDARVPEMALAGGSLNDDETGHIGFDDADGHVFFGESGLAFDGIGDGQVARFDYTYSSFTFSLSAEQTANGDDAAIDDVTGGLVTDSYDFGNTIVGVGASYAASISGVDVNVGAGVQDLNEIGTTYSLAATATLSNGLSFGATGARTDLDDDLVDFLGLSDDRITHRGIGIGYEMNALALGINYGEYEFDGDTDTGYGMAAAYDLGGGISLRAGFSQNNPDEGDDYNTYSLGAKMSF